MGKGMKGFQKGNNIGSKLKGRISPTKKEITWQENENGCWNCTSHKPNTWGYPQHRIGYKFKMISHTMYEQKYNKIPEGFQALHKCDNPSCINPDHIFLGTHKDNMRDKVEKGRQGKCGRKKQFKEEGYVI